MPRAIELPKPLPGYTGWDKKKEIGKGLTEDRTKRPIDQFIIGYTGHKKYEKVASEHKKFSEHKL